jgi:hypothetical protein
VFRYQEDLKLVLIATWNDYHEQTQIEPCDGGPLGTGHLLLDKTGWYVSRLKKGEPFQPMPESQSWNTVEGESPRIDEERFAEKLQRAVSYLAERYNPELGLIPDAQGPGGFEYNGKFWTFDKVYHLADNRLASMALEPYDPELSRAIAGRVRELYPDDPDGKANVVEGKPLTQEVWTVEGKVVEEGDDYIIFRGEPTKFTLWPLGGYLDVLTMYSLFAWMNGQDECARALLNAGKRMWDGYGLVDGPGKGARQYAVYKMALFLFALQVVQEPFEHFGQVEMDMWQAQDDTSGGIITGLTYDGRALVGPNTETTSLVILAYDHERIERLQQGFPEAERTDIEVCHWGPSGR